MDSIFMKIIEKYKVVAVFLLIILAYFIFRPKYFGLGMKCQCVGYAYNQTFKSNFNIVDSETFEPQIRGIDMTTTICYGIPYRCELNTGYEVLDPSLGIEE